MNNLRDSICSNERFDLTAWNGSVSQVVAWGVVESRLAYQNISKDYLDIHISKNTTGAEDYNAAYVLYVVVESILASFNHTLALEALFPPSRTINGSDFSYELASQECQSRGAGAPELNQAYPGLMVIDGKIEDYGTRMTRIGMALQIIILMVALRAMGIVAWGALPLVKEWPAQWINLVSQLDKEMLMESLEGTSTGGNFVTGNARVFICSMRRYDQLPRLILSTSPGYIDRDLEDA